MKVRMKVTVSGTRNGVSWPPRGEVLDVDDHEGKDLCAAGMADPVAERKEPEKAVAPEPEKRAEPDSAPAEQSQEEPVKRSPGRPRKPRTE